MIISIQHHPGNCSQPTNKQKIDGSVTLKTQEKKIKHLYTRTHRCLMRFYREPNPRKTETVSRVNEKNIKAIQMEIINSFKHD